MLELWPQLFGSKLPTLLLTNQACLYRRPPHAREIRAMKEPQSRRATNCQEQFLLQSTSEGARQLELLVLTPRNR